MRRAPPLVRYGEGALRFPTLQRPRRLSPARDVHRAGPRRPWLPQRARFSRRHDTSEVHSGQQQDPYVPVKHCNVLLYSLPQRKVSLRFSRANVLTVQVYNAPVIPSIAPVELIRVTPPSQCGSLTMALFGEKMHLIRVVCPFCHGNACFIHSLSRACAPPGPGTLYFDP